MNSKLINGIVLGLAMTSTAAFAAEAVTTSTSTASTISKEEVEQLPAVDRNDILARLSALEAHSKKSEWTQNVKIKADLRYRYENISVDGDTAENRQRIRVRLGAYADVNDFTTAGIRIRTGGGANSGNQTIGDSFDNKNVYFDLAYMTMLLNGGDCGAVTLGKMKYPWKTTTDLIWDSDVNPEGLAYTYSTQLDNTGLFGSVGGFKVVETGGAHDLNLLSAQIGGTRPLNDDLKLTAGGSLFYYGNADDFAPGIIDYKIIELFSEISFKDVLPVPFKVYGDYVNNVFESDDNNGICVGVKFGDTKKGKWETKLGYRRLEANAAPADFADSDYAGGGTDVKGFRVKAAYNIAKHLQVGVTGISGKEISTDTDVDTLHLDLIAKF